MTMGFICIFTAVYIMIDRVDDIGWWMVLFMLGICLIIVDLEFNKLKTMMSKVDLPPAPPETG